MRDRARLLVLFALLVWPLAAFGGRGAATAIPYGLICIVAAALRGRQLRLGSALDRALLVLLAAIALQALPLPGAIATALSPDAIDVRRALALGTTPDASLLPLTIDVRSTLWALVVFAGAAALFWSVRADYRRGGIRRTVRGIAGLGFVLSLFAIAQAATAGREIYWRFPTEFEGPLPFGPFINRNHFATWVIMAVPLCLGYAAARSIGRTETPDHIAMRRRLATMIEPRTAWLLAAAAAMTVALLLSLSRSGVVALGVSAIGTLALCRRHLDRQHRRRMLLAAATVAIVGLAWADIPALQGRLAGAPTSLKDRLVIWQETLPVVRDFWVAGTGAGTYQQSMFVYQQSSRTVYFNQAHNHYLQVASEGGLLVTLPALLAIAALVRVARRRLSGDASGLFWIRAGAACGLGAAALQSVWETGLVMPANAALAAVLAAVLVHDRD